MTRPSNRRRLAALAVALSIGLVAVAALAERPGRAWHPNLFEEPKTPNLPFFSVSLA